MHREMGLFCAPFLLLLLAIHGGESSTISFSDVTTFPDGSFQGLARVSSGAYSGYICGTTNKPNTADAQVICNQYGYASANLSYASFQGSPNIALKDPTCYWTEDDILNCPGSMIGPYSNSDCLDKAYNITCSSPYYSVNSTVRLYNGGSSGPVQWTDNNVNWYTFCSQNWGEADAQVACRQLGYKNGDQGVYGLSESTWAQAPDCSGHEIGVAACSGYSNSTSSSCSGGLPGGAVCSDPYGAYSYDVKNEYLFLDNKWMPICATNMSKTEIENAADNICQKNGYSEHGYERSVRVSAGFTAYVRAVICPKREDFSSCAFVQAPTGKGFMCYDKLSFACQIKDGDDFSYIWMIIRFAIPGVCITGALLVVFILHRLQERRKKKKKAAQQAAMAAQGNPGGVVTAAGGTPAGYPLGTTPPGYPLQHAAAQPPPPGSQQGSHAPPPAYNSIFQQAPVGGPVSTAKTNQVTPTGYGLSGYSTAGDYGDVPAPANYHLPPIQQTAKSYVH